MRILIALLLAAAPIVAVADSAWELSLARIDYEVAALSGYCVSDAGGPGKRGVTFACHRFVGTGAALRYSRDLVRRLSLTGDALYTQGRAGIRPESVDHANAMLGLDWRLSARNRIGLQVGGSVFAPAGSGIAGRRAQWQRAYGLALQRSFALSSSPTFGLRAGYFKTWLDDYYFGTTPVEAVLLQAFVRW